MAFAVQFHHPNVEATLAGSVPSSFLALGYNGIPNKGVPKCHSAMEPEEHTGSVTDGATISDAATATGDATKLSTSREVVPFSSDPPQLPLAKWTVGIYVCSNNDLYAAQMENLKDAEKVGCTPLLKIVAESSQGPVGGGVIRQYIIKQPDSNHRSPVIQDLGDRNMGSAEQLADFITFMKTDPKLKAENYALIINDHGNAWQGVCLDDPHKGWITLPELERACKIAREATDNKPLAFIGFDACMEATAETFVQLMHECLFMAGSEEIEGGPGWGYNQVCNSAAFDSAAKTLSSREELSPRAMVERIVDMAKGRDGDLPTMSAFDMSKAQGLLDSGKALRVALENTSVPKPILAKCVTDTQKFTMERDLYDFADRLSKLGDQDETLAAAAQDLKESLSSCVVREKHSSRHPNAHGMTAELLPQRAKKPTSINKSVDLSKIKTDSYANTRWERETGLNKAIGKHIFGRPDPVAPSSEPEAAV